MKSSVQPIKHMSLLTSVHEQLDEAAPLVRPALIATHRSPDVDALVATWLAERFLFKGRLCEVHFVPRSFTPTQSERFDCVVDVGCAFDVDRLVFDHKPPAFADRHNSCASRLVWDACLNRGLPVAHLTNLIDAVHDGDSSRRRGKSEAYRASKQSGVHASFARAKEDDPTDAVLYRRLRKWLEQYEREMRTSAASSIDLQAILSGLPKDPGTYILILRATAPRSVLIGRRGTLGTMNVVPGYYAYIGSAFGGLRGRLKHHLTSVEELISLWNVDYLRLVTWIEEIWLTTDSTKRECQFAECLKALPGAEIHLARFGAADCRCPAHLLYFSTKPRIESFKRKVRHAVSADCRVLRVQVPQTISEAASAQASRK